MKHKNLKFNIWSTLLWTLDYIDHVDLAGIYAINNYLRDKADNPGIECLLKQQLSSQIERIKRTSK